MYAYTKQLRLKEHSRPHYRKIHSNIQFLEPCFVLFHKCFSHLRLKLCLMFNNLKIKRIWLCKWNLRVQWVYDVLDFVLWVPQRVEHYRFAFLHAMYEQNPMKTVDIDIQTYIHALDLAFIEECKRGTSWPRLTQWRMVTLYTICNIEHSDL